MGRPRRAALISIVLAASVLVPASPVAAATVHTESAWTGSFGGASGSGTVTVRAFDTATGTVVLSLTGLRVSSRYPATIRSGVCPGRGSAVVNLGTMSSDGHGRMKTTVPLSTVQTATIRSATAGTRRVSVIVGSGAIARCATLAKSLAVTPQVWFSPFPPYKVPWADFVGSVDYRALFDPNAPWLKAAGRTNVFEFWGWAITEDADIAEVRREVRALTARGIAISIQVSALEYKDCGKGVEGFWRNIDGDLAMIRQIIAAGGTVSYLSLDEPFYYGSLYDGPQACHWSADHVAREVTEYVRAIHAAFPSIRIGDIEPWPAASWSDYARWLDAYRAVSGGDFPFFHIDVGPQLLEPGRAAELREMQRGVQAHGSRFGILYFGTDEVSDQAWIDQAQANVDAYEVEGATLPDDAIFQSWQDLPNHVLPETRSDTFTHLLADYARIRSRLALGQTGGGAGGLTAAGLLTTLGSVGVPGASVDVTATPLDGQYEVIDLTGTVPAGASQVVVGVRMNTEGAGPGAADVTLYQIGYAEGTAGADLAPPAWRLDGSSSWGRCDDGALTPTPSDRGGGEMLRVVLTPSQTLCLNSTPFRVTPGAAYRLSAAVRVPDGSAHAGYATAVFLGADGIETRRDKLPLVPAPLATVTALTDGSGRFAVGTGSLEPGRYRVRAVFAGNTDYWPAAAVESVATVP